jgi:hypothetical protein
MALPNYWELESQRLFRIREAQDLRVNTRKALDTATETANLTRQRMQLEREAQTTQAELEDPEVKETLDEIADKKSKNAFVFALDMMTRPDKAVRNMLEQAWYGSDDFENPMQAAWAGMQGAGEEGYADILKKHGWDDVDIGLPGPFQNLSKTDILGGIMDIGFSPWNLVSFGPGAKLMSKGASAAGKAATKAPLIGPGARATRDFYNRTLKFGGDLMNQPVTTPRLDKAGNVRVDQWGNDIVDVVPLDDAIDPMRKLTKQDQLARHQIEHGWEGDVPVQLPGAGREVVVEAGPGQVHHRFRAGGQVVDEAGNIIVAPREIKGTNWLKEATPDELESFAALAMPDQGEGRNIYDALMELDQLMGQTSPTTAASGAAVARIRSYIDELADSVAGAAGEGLDTTGNLADILRWYYGDYNPAIQWMGEGLGLESLLGNYMSHIKISSKETQGLIASAAAGSKEAEKLLKAGAEETKEVFDRAFVNLGFTKPRQNLSAKTIADFAAAGYLTDPRLILTIAGTSRKAELRTRNLRDTLWRKHGFRLTEDNLQWLEKGVKAGQKHRGPEGWTIVSSKRWKEFKVEDSGTLVKQMRGKLDLKDSDDARKFGAVFGKPDIKRGETLADQMQFIKGEEFFAIPTKLAKEVKRIFQPEQATGFWRGFDALQAVWKRSVTSLFPAFHVRNLMSNAVNSWLKGGYDTRDWVKAFAYGRNGKAHNVLDQTTGELMNIERDIIEAMIENGAWGTGRYSFSEMRMAARREMDFEEMRRMDSVPLLSRAPEAIKNPLDKAYRVGRSVGEFNENMSKLGHVMTRMRKGDSLIDAITGANGANKAMFTYDLSSPFMDSTLVRAMPFARWFTQNIPFQVNMLLENPARQAMIPKVMHALSYRDLKTWDTALLPHWTNEEPNIVWNEVTNAEGETRLTMTTSMGLPQENLNMLFTETPTRTLEGLLSSASPFLRAIPESIFQRSAFTGEDINDPAYTNYYRRFFSVIGDIPGLRDLFGYETREIPDGLGGMKQVDYSTRPMAVYWATSALGRILSSIGTGRAALEAAFGEEEEGVNKGTDAFAKVLKGFSGINVSEFDMTRPLTRASLRTDAVYMQYGEDLEEYATQLDNFEISGKQYSVRRSEIFNDLFVELNMIRMEELAGDLRTDPNDRETIERQRQAMELARKNMMGPEMLAIQIYYNIDPNDPEYRQGNIRQFYRDRDDALDMINEVAGPEAVERVRTSYMRKLPEAVQAIERQRNHALEIVRPYFNMPKYIGFTPEQERMADYAKSQIAHISSRYRGMGEGVTRRAERDYVRATGDVQGMLLARRSRSRRNPQRTAFQRRYAHLFQRWFSDLWDADDVMAVQGTLSQLDK